MLPSLEGGVGEGEGATGVRIFTVGHGARPLEDLVALLAEHQITQLVDVRHFPRSRRNPQFNTEFLASALPQRGIAYVWLGEELGGFRPGGYEAWMSTEVFRRGLARLEELTAQRTTAIMCAETVWFRCHRRFIARELVARGIRVTHIVDVGKHTYEEPLSGASRGPRVSNRPGHANDASGGIESRVGHRTGG